MISKTVILGSIMAAAIPLKSVLAQSSISPPTTDLEKDKKIANFLVDFAPGEVSAAGLLGLGGDAVKIVENPRNLVVALSGLGGAGTSFGLSITPARTSWAPLSMTLGTYKESLLNRLIGTASFSYAQGSKNVTNIELQRNAVSFSTGAYIDPSQDPVLAGTECPWNPPVVNPNLSDEEVQNKLKDANNNYLDCVNKSQKAARDKWNASRVSFSIGAGRIKRDDGAGNSHNTGNSLSLGGIYGFNAAGMDMGLQGMVRRTHNELVLESLINGPLRTKSNTLAALRLSGGGTRTRLLIEASNASKTDVAASERVFRKALGIDFRITESNDSPMWVGIRYGRMAKVNGTGEENTGILTLNFSPKSTQ